jgi:hypothetical protein
VLTAVLHDYDFTEENILKCSHNFHHHIKRKPLQQLHLREVFMVTMNMEILRITSQDLQDVPADWTAKPRHSDCAVIRILGNTSS